MEGWVMYLLVTSSQYFWQKICYQKNWLLHFSKPQYIKFNDGSGFTFQLLLKKENILSPFGMVLFSFDKVHTILWVPWFRLNLSSQQPHIFLFHHFFFSGLICKQMSSFYKCLSFCQQAEKEGIFWSYFIEKTPPLTHSEVVVPYQVHSETPLIF